MTLESGLLQQASDEQIGANCLSFLQVTAPHLFHLSTDPEIQLLLSFLVSLPADYNNSSLFMLSDLPALQLINNPANFSYFTEE